MSLVSYYICARAILYQLVRAYPNEAASFTTPPLTRAVSRRLEEQDPSLLPFPRSLPRRYLV